MTNGFSYPCSDGEVIRLKKPVFFFPALIAHPEERSWVFEQLVVVVLDAPPMGEFGAAPLPRLQPRGAPHHVQEGEDQEGLVFLGLVGAPKVDLRKGILLRRVERH